MERLVTSPQGGFQDAEYLAQVLSLIRSAPVLMFANTNENRSKVRCVVSVREFTDPRARTQRWALVVDAVTLSVWDYVNREEARRAYVAVLARGTADGLAWDVSSDGL